MLSSLGNQTVSDLIISLLQAETAAQTLYLRLMEAFAHEPEAAEVWWKLGADEAAHIRLLEQILDSLPPRKTSGPRRSHLAGTSASGCSFLPRTGTGPHPHTGGRLPGSSCHREFGNQRHL